MYMFKEYRQSTHVFLYLSPRPVPVPAPVPVPMPKQINLEPSNNYLCGE